MSLQDVSSAIDRDDLRTLFALARTCRALLTPALDVMWYRQHTLVHLFKCLPGDLWELTTSASLPQRKELVSCHLSLSLDLFTYQFAPVARNSRTRAPLFLKTGRDSTSMLPESGSPAPSSLSANPRRTVRTTCWTVCIVSRMLRYCPIYVMLRSKSILLPIRATPSTFFHVFARLK